MNGRPEISPLAVEHAAFAAGRLRLLTMAIVLAMLSNFSVAGRRLLAADEPAAKEQMLAHMVFFTLNDSSAANRQKLVESCKKYLVDHPGEVYFSVGTLADVSRDVNDRDFDVALHMVFKNRAAYDAYLTAPRHLKFVEEHKPTWKKVRVFDSTVDP